MKEAEYEALLADYQRRGGVIHRMPTVYAIKSTGTLPDAGNRQAVSSYYSQQEEKRNNGHKNAIRRWNEINARPTRDNLSEPEAIAPRRQRNRAKSARKEIKAEPAEGPKAILRQQPEAQMTRNKYMTASEEVTIFRFNDGRSEVHTIDYQGREYISRFGRNGQFQGTVFANKFLFAPEIK